MHRSTGTLTIDPPSRVKLRPWWCILRGCEELAAYYRDLATRGRPRIDILSPAWGCHLSIIREEQPPHPDRWARLEPAELPFTYDPVVYTNGRHLWLPAQFPMGEGIRASVGLSPVPEFPYHLTIGVLRSRQLDGTWPLE